MRIKELKSQLNTGSKIMYLSPSIERGTPITGTRYNKDENIFALVYGNAEPMSGEEIISLIEEKNVPDDAIVTMMEPHLTDNNANIVRWLAEDRDGKYCAVNDKENEDVSEEIAARMEDAWGDGAKAKETLEGIFEAGFTMKDFKDLDAKNKGAYDWAKHVKEKFSLKEIGEK